MYSYYISSIMVRYNYLLPRKPGRWFLPLYRYELHVTYIVLRRKEGDYTALHRLPKGGRDKQVL